MSNRKQEFVAMILAGGQGSRLKELTAKNAKPAVPFGGKYRIIDFALSNCSNSGITTVGVLTQYEPLILNTHIGIGSPWDLDRMDGGIRVLPPFVGADGGRWYKGTANAIYENIHFIDEHDPDYVLILSGDHIYKMDYSVMLDHHKEKEADLTIAVIKVPWEETSRFGILNTREDLEIYEFDEKPEHAKSNLASMGIYIFNWKMLKQMLIDDENDPNSENDFGKNIIPTMINGGKKVYAYEFMDYWKDVGTIHSLWEANMDLLHEDNGLNLFDKKWRIYSVNPINPPHYITQNGVVEESLVNEGCYIDGTISHSVISPGVTVMAGAKVVDSVVLPGAIIEEGAQVYRCIVMSGERVPAGMVVGVPGSDEIRLYFRENKPAEAAVGV